MNDGFQSSRALIDLLTNFHSTEISVEVVVALDIVVLGSLALRGCLCQAGYRHLLVALVFMSVWVMFLCKESSVVSRVSGPLKARFPLLRHT
jgi:hypothetical protein